MAIEHFPLIGVSVTFGQYADPCEKPTLFLGYLYTESEYILIYILIYEYTDTEWKVSERVHYTII